MNREVQYQIVKTPIGYSPQMRVWWWPFWIRMGYVSCEQMEFYYPSYENAKAKIEQDKRYREIQSHPEIRKQKLYANFRLIFAIFLVYLLVKFLT